MKMRGFTLIEVLVALTIIAIALGAMLRSGNAAIEQASDLRMRTLANWIAENRLAEHRAKSNWPEIGSSNGETEMGGVQLRWQETVNSTPNRQFRRLEIKIFDTRDSLHAWCQRVSFLSKPDK